MTIIKILDSDWNQSEIVGANKIVLQLDGTETVKQIHSLINKAMYYNAHTKYYLLKGGEWLLGWYKGPVTLYLNHKGSTISKGDHALEVLGV
jgi:hypothetical protein